MILLKDETIEPTDEVLSEVLGNIYPVYTHFTDIITSEPFNLQQIWRYYNDGKAWLCKIVHKKKTVSWLSIDEGYFQVTTYFTAKLADDIDQLPIDKNLIAKYHNILETKNYSYLSPQISTFEQLKDLMIIMTYKKAHL
ncbi:MAG: DUF3788 domain-containing protein [Candidatus Cloacimonetes bacterium]|nr:DUF3788 domain-containing protein [Candidatus Cloacimonadota bacterium]